MSSSDRWIYAYPIALVFKESEVSETFVTFDEPNLFVEPYDMPHSPPPPQDMLS